MIAGNVIRKYAEHIPTGVLRRLANLYRPFAGAGIKIDYIADDYREARVKLVERFSNKNYVGTHFGGSIYAMTDPFYMLMIMQNIGRGYIVWDKAAKIDFKKPGKGTLTATFKITEEELDRLKDMVDGTGKTLIDLPVKVIDEDGDEVAEVIKTIYVRKKERKRAEHSSSARKIS